MTTGFAGREVTPTKSICFLVYDVSLMGGAERVAISLANALADFYRVHLVSVFQAKERPCFEVDGRVEQTVLSRESGSITLKLPVLCRRLHGFFKEYGIDVSFAITAGVNSVMIGAAAFTRVRTVFCEHSNLDNHFYGKKHRFRQWLGARFADQVVTLTERDAGNFRRVFHLPAGKVRCIYNWIGDEWLEEETAYRTDSRAIVTAGRLTRVKGYDQLAAAAQKVLERYPGWEWHIYGEGEDREKIERDIEERGLAGRLILKGAHPRMRDVYPGYALYVLTSYNEGLPLALLEAQACGLPAVAYNCPTGPEEILTDGVNGLLVPPGNQQALADAIGQLLEDGERRRRFSEHCRDHIGRFSRSEILLKWRALIEE